MMERFLLAFSPGRLDGPWEGDYYGLFGREMGSSREKILEPHFSVDLQDFSKFALHNHH